MLLDVLSSAPGRPPELLGAPSKHGNLTLKIAIFEVLRGLREVKIGPQRPLGPFLERLGLMDASWSALGRL